MQEWELYLNCIEVYSIFLLSLFFLNNWTKKSIKARDESHRYFKQNSIFKDKTVFAPFPVETANTFNALVFS